MASRPRGSRQDRTGGTASDRIPRPFLIPQETLAHPNTNEAGNDASPSGYLMKPLPYTVTIPPPDDYYVVREDQLTRLGQGETDYALEICLAAGGMAIGLLPGFGTTLAQLLTSKPIGTFDLFLAALTIVFGVVSVTKSFQYFGQRHSKSNLIAHIKSGQKAKIEGQ
jgi:hypothetical protein